LHVQLLLLGTSFSGGEAEESILVSSVTLLSAVDGEIETVPWRYSCP